MLSVHPQYVIDEHDHPKAVMLSLNEWKQVLEELEELDDIRAYDKAKKGDSESIPFEQAVHEIESEYKA